jgi:putative oxidoreductase
MKIFIKMTNSTNIKAINISLWVAQAILATMFIMAGAMKLFQPIEELSQVLPWVTSMPVAFVRFIGLSEVLGGLGLILFAILRKQPLFTVYAAIGLSLIMVLASVFHVSRGEFLMIGTNVFLLAIALFIAWGRTKKAPITGKA